MTSVIFHALIAVYLTEALRILAPEAWRDKKPLACAFCMAGWTSIGVNAFDSLPPLPFVASTGLTYALLRFFERPPIHLGDDT